MFCRRKKLGLFLLGVTLYAAVTTSAAAKELVIKNGWINQPPPGVMVAAGYCDITNQSKTKVVIVRVQSPRFRTIEIHDMKMANEMASMVKRDTLEIAKGATFKLEPMHTHLMLMGMQGKLAIGESVPLEFHLADGLVIKTTFTVKKAE